jgi:hypothetical protein
MSQIDAIRCARAKPAWAWRARFAEQAMFPGVRLWLAIGAISLVDVL